VTRQFTSFSSGKLLRFNPPEKTAAQRSITTKPRKSDCWADFWTMVASRQPPPPTLPPSTVAKSLNARKKPYPWWGTSSAQSFLGRRLNSSGLVEGIWADWRHVRLPLLRIPWWALLFLVPCGSGVRMWPVDQRLIRCDRDTKSGCGQSVS
jgi:hypothetical protein